MASWPEWYSGQLESPWPARLVVHARQNGVLARMVFWPTGIALASQTGCPRQTEWRLGQNGILANWNRPGQPDWLSTADRMASWPEWYSGQLESPWPARLVVHGRQNGV